MGSVTALSMGESLVNPSFRSRSFVHKYADFETVEVDGIKMTQFKCRYCGFQPKAQPKMNTSNIASHLRNMHSERLLPEERKSRRGANAGNSPRPPMTRTPEDLELEDTASTNEIATLMTITHDESGPSADSSRGSVLANDDEELVTKPSNNGKRQNILQQAVAEAGIGEEIEAVEKAMDGAKDSIPLSQVLKELCAPNREMGIQGGEMSSIEMYYVMTGSIAPMAISTPKTSDQRVEEGESSFLDKQEVMTSNSLEAVVSERSLPAEDAKACSNVSPDQVCFDGVNSGREELSSPHSQQLSFHADSSDQLTVGAEAMDEEAEDDLDSSQDAPAGPCNQDQVSSEGAAGGVIQISLPAPVADLQHSEAFFRYPGASGDWFPERKFDYQLKQRNAKRQPVFGELSPRPWFDQPHAMPLLSPEVAVENGEITLDQMLTVSPSKRRKKSESDKAVDGQLPHRAVSSEVDHPPSNCSLSQEMESLHTEEDMQSSVGWNPVDDVQFPVDVEPPDFTHSSEIFEACDDHDLAEQFSLSDGIDLSSVDDDILRKDCWLSGEPVELFTGNSKRY